MSKTFFDSDHCLSRSHCKTCRDIKEGDSFRQSLTNTFSDLEDSSFECPFGIPWSNEPTFLDKLKSITAEVKKVLSAEEKLAEDELVEKRLSICQGTETIPKCGMYNEEKDTCRKCGCIVKYKTRLKEGSCPEKKW